MGRSGYLFLKNRDGRKSKFIDFDQRPTAWLLALNLDIVKLPFLYSENRKLKIKRFCYCGDKLWRLFLIYKLIDIASPLSNERKPAISRETKTLSNYP